MIATRRGLLVLLAIASLLTLLLVRELRRAPPEVLDRAIVPGLDPDRITELTWDRSPLPEVKVTRAGGDWTWSSSGGWAKADARVVRDVLAALRGARWHRRAEVGAAGTVHAQLSATVGTTARVIGIGAALEGTEQAWIVVGEHALLVDRWVARALNPEPLALRVNRPIEDAEHVDAVLIEITGEPMIRIEGKPLRETSPRVMQLRTDVMTTLQRALEAVEIVRLSRPPPDADVTFYVSAGTTLRFVAACPDDPTLAWVFSDMGNGCITRAAYDAVLAAAKALRGEPKDIMELRPVPFDLDRIRLADGSTIDLTRQPTIGGKGIDSRALAELLAVLAAPGELAGENPKEAKALMMLDVKGSGTVVLELLGDGLVRRAGEAVALKLTPAAYAALTRDENFLLDRAVWTEEPTTIRAIHIDGIGYLRGAVIGEWTRSPAGPVDGARVEALVGALASLNRSRDVAAFANVHEVSLVVGGPVGAPTRHVLQVGPLTQGGCPARAGTETVRLPAAVCASVAALAK